MAGKRARKGRATEQERGMKDSPSSCETQEKRIQVETGRGAYARGPREPSIPETTLRMVKELELSISDVRTLPRSRRKVEEALKKEER